MTSTTNMFVASWSRSGTDLTITHNAHGLGTGDRVVIRNANEDMLIATVNSSTINTFVVTCASSGGTSGTEAAYGALFTAVLSQSGGDVTGVSISAPGGLSGSSQLNNVTLYANNQESSCVFTVPAGLNEGAGGYNDKRDINLVTVEAKNADGTGTSGNLTATTSYNLGSNFNQITVGGIDNFTPILLTMKF